MEHFVQALGSHESAIFRRRNQVSLNDLFLFLFLWHTFSKVSHMQNRSNGFKLQDCNSNLFVKKIKGLGGLPFLVLAFFCLHFDIFLHASSRLLFANLLVY